MFDLEQTIAGWRQQMLAAGVQTPVPLEELELHLRDDIEQQMEEGADAEHAFATAAQRMGQGEMLRKEFRRAGGFLAPLKAAPPQLVIFAFFSAVVGIAFYFSMLFEPWAYRYLVRQAGISIFVFAYCAPLAWSAFWMIYQPQKRLKRSKNITKNLVVCMAVSLFTLVLEFTLDHHRNITVTGLLVNFVLPCLWIALLNTPSMKRFCGEAPEPTPA